MMTVAGPANASGTVAAGYQVPTSWNLNQTIGCSVKTTVTASGSLLDIGAAVVVASVGWGCANGPNNSLGNNVYSVGSIDQLLNLIKFNCYSPANLSCNFQVSPTPISCPSGSSLDATLMRCVVCPANSTKNGTICTCNDTYEPDIAGSACVIAPTANACPAHMSGLPCACDSGYVPSWWGGCVQAPTCPIDPLPKPPFDGDTNPACTASLEKGRGKDVDNACPPLNPKMTEPNSGQIKCLTDKIRRLGIPYDGRPSATIRTEAYQQHLLDIWKKSIEIEKTELSFDEVQVCATLIADVANEKKQHGIDAPPSKKNSKAPHVLGNAVDIPKSVVNAMIEKATMADAKAFFPGCIPCLHIPLVTGDVEDYVNSAAVNPPACNLRWGGRFKPYDPVHFQLP